MKKTYFLVLFLFLNFNALANDVTKTVVKDFTINSNTIPSNDRASETKQISVTLTGIYSSKKNSVTVQFGKTSSDSITLIYPLDFNSFKIRFDSLFNKKNAGSLPTYQSSLEVFYWVVSINEKENNRPLAGELLVNNFLVVSEEGDSRKSQKNNQYARNDLLFSKLDEFNLHSTNLNLLNKKTFQLKSRKFLNDTTIQTLVTNHSLSQILEFKILALKNVPNGPKSWSNVDTFASSESTLDKINSENFNDATIWLKSGDSTIIELDEKIINIIKANNKVIDETQIKINSIQKNLLDDNIFKIENVTIQFERGFLERIQVSVKMKNGVTEIFENFHPIGFSSIDNFKNFSNIKLFPRTNNSNINYYKRQFIYLSDVIQNYHNRLDVLTKDYSPADTVVDVSPNTNPFVKLTKQSSIHIIDGKTFTDLNGFNEKSPNGLVQVELSRRFNINTKRIQAHKQINFGFFSYLHAQVNFSKIENKLKGLPLRNERVIENQTVISPNYATNLDFMRYENLSIRTDINLLLWDVPHFKLTYYVDFGLKYGHTPIVDSTFSIDNSGILTTTARDLDAHSFTLFPRIWMELFAERRYGLKLSYQTNFTRIYSNNNFKQVLSYSGKGQDLASLSINPASRWSHTIEAFAFFDPNPNSHTGKIFALARFNFQHKDANTFFPQILLGYAFNIFK